MATSGRVLWNHYNIVSCSCPTSCNAHVYCPCQKYNGRAVSRSTEDRHWNDAILLIGQTIDRHAQAHHQTTESVDLYFPYILKLPLMETKILAISSKYLHLLWNTYLY